LIPATNTELADKNIRLEKDYTDLLARVMSLVVRKGNDYVVHLSVQDDGGTQQEKKYNKDKDLPRQDVTLGMSCMQ
jgi:hypothetical protein